MKHIGNGMNTKNVGGRIETGDRIYNDEVETQIVGEDTRSDVSTKMFVGIGGPGCVQRTPPETNVRRSNRSLVRPKKYSKDSYLIYTLWFYFYFDTG